MTKLLVDLQTALVSLELDLNSRIVLVKNTELDNPSVMKNFWFRQLRETLLEMIKRKNELKELFSVFQKTHENVDLEGLEQKAKTYGEIGRWIWQVEKADQQEFLKRLHADQWLSVEDVTALLTQVFSEKVVAEEKNVEYAKLVAAQAEEYAEKLEGKVLVDHKQLSDSLDRLAEDCHDKIIDELKFPAHHRHSGWAKVLQPIIWGWFEKLIHDSKDLLAGSDEVRDPCECPSCHQDYSACTCHNDNLEGSESLSPEEIRDVEASEKEFASGKCKTFETAEDLIADLHETREKRSGKTGSNKK